MKKLICLLLCCMMLCGCGKSEIESINDVSADISDFEHYTDGDNVKLTEYKGKEKVLYIESQYEMGGNMLNVDLSEFQMRSDEVEFVILGDGIRSINYSTFNSSEVKMVYFPKSMEAVYDTTLTYLHPDDEEKIEIYYAGTEEEWNAIFTNYERQTVEEAWNSSDDAEEKGEAVGKSIADKLNGMMGSYDSSGFEYHYSVAVDDLVDIINK